MKFSPKCRTNDLATIYTIFGKFLLILQLGRGPKSGLGKSLILTFLRSVGRHSVCSPSDVAGVFQQSTGDV